MVLWGGWEFLMSEVHLQGRRGASYHAHPLKRPPPPTGLALEPLAW